MPNADIGANGWLWLAIEDTYGTALDPSVDDTVGVYVPILSETLMYNSTPYKSNQIRQQAVASDVEPSFYHVEGDIVMEVDAHYMPYFMAASRHTTVESLTGPFLYSSIPAGYGATYPGGTPLGLSIAIVRDQVGFLYGGCVVNRFSCTLQDGVAQITMSMMGLSEVDFADAAPDPTFAAPSLFGASDHAVYVDSAGTAPSFASADHTFNGFTWEVNHNAEPQNRVTPTRAATYIKYGITEPTYTTELDFVSKTEYTHFKATDKRAVKFESLKGGSPFSAATEAFRMTFFNSFYQTYEVGLSGMGDLVMARVTGDGLFITGGSAYKMECKSSVDLGL